MAVDYESAKTYIFSVVDSSGSPLVGLSGTWTTLVGVESGVSITPTFALITEVGGGLYQTTINWVDVVSSDGLFDGEEVAGVIDWGVSVTGPERYTYTSFCTRDFSLHKNTNSLSTIKSDVDLVKEIQTGKWEISGTQLNLYKSDNTTLVASFNLYDKSGIPTGDAPYSRVKF